MQSTNLHTLLRKPLGGASTAQRREWGFTHHQLAHISGTA